MCAQPTLLERPAAMPPATRPAMSKVTLKRATRRGPGSRASFLADASKRLAASLDLKRTVRTMTELSVPELGTACVVCLLRDARTVGDVGAAKHADERRQELLAGVANTAFKEPHGWQPLLSVASSGRPLVLSQLATAGLLGDGRPPHILLEELGIKTAMLVPVIQGERTLAVVVFLSQRTRQYAAAQICLAQELVSRFALALEAAHMYRACKQALEDSRESLATTIHDLMSPLTYIKGTTQRLQRIKRTLADPSASSDLYIRLEAIDAAANRMASALSALLQTTRLEPAEWPQRHAARTDLVALARRVVAVEQLMARQHSICLREAPPALEGAWRAERLEHMLANLIGNAVKYSPPGSCVDVSLTADVDDEGRWAVVRIMDRGVGIPAVDLPFVFEPFRRGSNVGEIVGTGLGLASVWQTVKTYDGRLSVDSEEQVGTCFTVRLPLPLSGGPFTSSTSTPD